MRFKLWIRNPRNRRLFILGAAAAAVVVLLFLRRRGAGAATAGPAVDTGAAPYDVGPLVDPSTLTDGTPGALNGGGGDVGVSPVTPDDLGNLQDQIGDLNDAIGNLGDGDTASDGTPLDPSPVAPGTAPSAPSAGPSSTPGFWWNIGGKSTYVTRKNVGAFLAELKKHGVSVASWAANHAQAARAVGIPVPHTPPKRSPGGSSPAHETGGVARSAPTSQVAKPTPVFVAPTAIPGAPAGVSALLGAAVQPVLPPPPAPSFAWGGKTWHHGDLAAFKGWLGAHGVKWTTWAGQHPAAAKILTG